jgi:hypothetical protein
VTIRLAVSDQFIGGVSAPPTARLFLAPLPVQSFETRGGDPQAILTTPIRQLALRIEGSPVEKFVDLLYRELEAAGLSHFRPAVYLSDEWGCPAEEPVIGIPFYLADPALAELERELNDLEDEREIMMYLRHEAGHAFNYAWELYRTAEWRRRFGSFRRPYVEDYVPIPFSRRFVRHIPGWYAQKHPDEDFAETFAVWLTPDSNWQQKYRGWPALRKLEYVARIAREVGETHPVRALGEFDVTVDEIDETVAEFYERSRRSETAAIRALPLGHELAEIFAQRGGEGEECDAAALLTTHRKTVVDKVAHWTGVRRPLAKALIDEMIRQVRAAGHRYAAGDEQTILIDFTAYATVLGAHALQRLRGRM